MVNVLKLCSSTQFKKDLKRVAKQGKNRKLIDDVIEKLQRQEPLPQKNRDHALVGDYKGYRECHITPDWLLIYRITNNNAVELLELTRTGSHSELFR
ncbi:type II toxin-antitoxin system YafQ family toxin [Legionella anisa]|uniref:Type II toxin-antitoxin system YafQ family toxin n=1 Tax=Legionella anisa TaxID=28082 RepID=A0AAX0WZV3_9GAMM|nr:type II toxin-antitoxin system YafQ family toxin [Legionella anisa]KTC70084.1 mRNA interferase YafQ [Legionella anisa]PNL73934.1 type II toxin-antitoxin system YafQ family toxin [Legionella anisa]UAK81530.1 type II toxin-antitoxin system YafQ family toxin [Legionella anisa]